MAKKFSLTLYDRQHIKNLLKQATRLDKIFTDAILQGAKIGEATGFCDPEGEFMFDKFPSIKQRAEKFFNALHGNLLLTITEGNRQEWLLSAAKNKAMVEGLFNDPTTKYGAIAKRWTEPNLTALKQFNERKEKGMNLSDRVWNLTHQFKQELELALELGLGEGKSAAALTQDVRKYLNEPNRLFRRVRDEKGQLRLSKAAQAYHPGTGVYRSSYKNALRLTATENNIAYRTADQQRWKKMDFVTGIEIKLSGNHTLNGERFTDICDELQGKYPKDFKFVGWHPFCRCFSVPILADEDERTARLQAYLDDKELPDEPYSGEVTELPENFKTWVRENSDKIATARNVPYFIKDNRQAVENIINPPKEEKQEEAQETPKLTPQEIAKIRHSKRSKADIEEIQRNWNYKRISDYTLFASEYEDSSIINGLINNMYEANRSNNQDDFEFSLKSLKDYLTGKYKYTPNPALQTNYANLSEVCASLKKIGDDNGWFPTGRMNSLEETTKKNVNGSSNRITGKIKLTPERSRLVKSAMEKIGNAKAHKITKDEADAMATLWHEMNHQMHIGDESPGLPGSISRSFMELANEFVSRKTLPEFYSSMGCKTTPFEIFTKERASTGYDDMVRSYTEVIEKAKLDMDAVLKSVRHGLFNTDYSKQKSTLADGLKAGGLKGTDDQINEVVSMCQREEKVSRIIKYIKKNNMI